jgi:hypothetical protein
MNIETVQGTLNADGTLQLDQKPNLPAGQVLVTLQPVTPCMPGQRKLVDVIDEIHQGQQARGFHGRSAQEIEVGRQEGEGEYELRMKTLLSQKKSGAAGGA